MSGIIVGTAGYMAPDQVRGETVDARADIFSLGVILYEMLAGRHPFRRSSTFETLHAVLTEDPPNVASLNADVPAALARIAMRLLEKAPEERFQTALDVLWALEQADVAPAAAGPVAKRLGKPHRWWRDHALVWGAAFAAAVVALVALAVLARGEREQARVPELTRFTWTLPSGMSLASTPVVSPDGRRVAFVGRTGAISHLYVRELGALEVVQIPGSTGALHPFWSPDGSSLGYFVGGAQVMRVAWRGGAPVPIANVDGVAARARSPLLRTDSNPVYVPLPRSADGVLLYVVDNRVEARRFNWKTLTLGDDARALDGVSPAGTALTQAAMLSASADVLVFAASTVPYGERIEAVDRGGRRLRVWDQPEAQNWPRISPDGRYLARQRVDPLRNTPDVWGEDLERGTNLRVTTALEPDIRAVWSPDGRYLAYVTGNIPYRPGKRVLSIAAADGTGIVGTLPCPADYCEPTDWTDRGLLVNVLVNRGQNVWDVWLVPTADRPAEALLAEDVNEAEARVSPDGQWIAYVSDESKKREVSVRSISRPVRRVPISPDGGDFPVWRRDGQELFYIDPQGQLRAVTVRWKNGTPTFGLPVKLNVPPIGRGHWGTPYDVSPDGSRIYFLRRNDDPPPHEIRVVVGWRTLLE